MQSILLLTTTSIATEHLFELMRAFLPVYVLLEGVEIQQGQHLATRVVRPEGSHDFIFDGTSIAVEGEQSVSEGMKRLRYFH